MEIRPQHRSLDFFHCLPKMMVIIPVNADEDKTQYIASEFWQKWIEGSKRSLLGRSQLQDHDRDNDGKNTITEGFESSFVHYSSIRNLFCFFKIEREREIEKVSVTFCGLNDCLHLCFL